MTSLPPQLTKQHSFTEDKDKEIKEDVLDLPEDSNQLSVSSKNESCLQESQSLFSGASQNDLSQSQSFLSETHGLSQSTWNQEVLPDMNFLDTICYSEKEVLCSQEFDGINGKVQEPNDEKRPKVPEFPELGTVDGAKDVEKPDDNLHSSETKKNVEDKNVTSKMAEKVPSLVLPMVERTFVSKEEEIRYRTAVDRCMKAFATCLKRFPEHYKSQYKIAFVATYFETHRVSYSVCLFVRFIFLRSTK